MNETWVEPSKALLTDQLILVKSEYAQAIEGKTWIDLKIQALHFNVFLSQSVDTGLVYSHKKHGPCRTIGTERDNMTGPAGGQTP